MVFMKNMFGLGCTLILLTIVTSINCNKFNSKIGQIKRFPRQVNANNNQQIDANNTRSAKTKRYQALVIFDGYSSPKHVLYDKLTHRYHPVSFSTNKRRNRQSNIYSPALQGRNSYNHEEYMSQPGYLANKDYYDNYYANYYQSYYQTTPEPIRHQQQNYPSQATLQSHQQSPPERSNGLTAPSTLTSNNVHGGNRVYINENGLFEISKLNVLDTGASPISPVIDDDAIVFESDESQYGNRDYFSNDNIAKQSQMHDDNVSNSKPISFNGSPVFL